MLEREVEIVGETVGEFRGAYLGARFYKCALQVNPSTYAEEYQGKLAQKEDEYNHEIWRQCEKNGIEIVGLADHGQVESSEGLRKFLTEKDITVFPGFEIASSEKIHMVCLYAKNTDSDTLNGYLGQLMGTNFKKLEQQRTYPSSLSCEDIDKKIKEQDGFWYAAHMTGRNGLLRLDGSGGGLAHLWKKDELVIAGQIPVKIEGLRDNYRKIIENKNPDYERKKPIVIINAKDVYEPETLSNPAASCLVKMTTPTFDAFKKAFHDPESRIRLNHDVPEKPYSVINSIQWEVGGFFKENTLCFSKHLNTVIGGRGTGKTTLVEGIRYVLGLPIPKGSDKELNEFYKRNLGDSKITLHVTSKAQGRQRYTISRRFGEHAIVKNAEGGISHLLPEDILPDVKLLGQNEILDIAKDDAEKLSLIQSFLPDSSKLDENLQRIKREMANNREQRVKANEEFDRLESEVQKKPKLEEQLEHFKKLGIEQKLKNAKQIEKEKNIQASIEGQIEKVEVWLERYEEVFDLEFLQETRIESLPNKTIFEKERDIFEKLKGHLDTSVGQANKNLEVAINEHSGLKKEWQTEADKIKGERQQAIAQLPGHAGKTGEELGKEYTDLIRSLEYIERQKIEYTRQKKLIKTLKEERKELLEVYRETAFNRFKALRETAEELNRDNLKGKVKLKVKRFGNKQPLKDFLCTIDGIGEAKIKWLDKVETLDLLAWSEWIKEKNREAFMDAYRDYGLQKGTVEKLLGPDLGKRLKLEEIELEEKVEIELNVAHDGGENYRPLEYLSTGQQCTAILNLLLLNLNCDDPLIIDQPEDHLDNAFIADRIVHDLREFKTRRQFIFTTHNANIPVFGDAELIAVLDSERNEGEVKEAGSIDKKEICEQTAQILEGGEAAFQMRRRKYGY